jgi:peptidoglycan/LPS O-acetylase OafA/YrhL
MISGFYMALILTEKYRGPGSKKLFWGNRFLRIYPLYWVVAGISAVIWVGSYLMHHGSGPLQVFKLLDLTGVLLITLSNICIFGQDLVMFTGTDGHGHVFLTPDFTLSYPPLWSFLIVPQAWSLSVELMFYLVAPFLVRRSVISVLVVIVLSLALRAYLFFACNLKWDPWNYRFFPTEIAFFLAGAIAYRGYVWLEGATIRRLYLRVWAGCFFVLFFAYQFLPSFTLAGLSLNQWIYYVIVGLSIPVLFLLTKNWRLDRYIGELSYPVYIVHIILIALVAQLWRYFGIQRGEHTAVVVFSLAASLILIHWVLSPIETVRRALAARLRPQPSAMTNFATVKRYEVFQRVELR